MSEQRPSAEGIESDISATRREIEQTLKALEGKLSPSRFMDQALGYARHGGGEMATNFGRAVKNNPLALSLVGVGLAWLMMSGRNSGHGSRVSAERSGGELGAGYAPPGVGEGQSVTGATRPAYGQESTYPPYTVMPGGEHEEGGATERAAGTAARAKGAAKDISGRAAAGSGRAKERASEFVAGARERGSRLRERAANVGSGVGERAASARVAAGDYGRRAREGFSHAQVRASHYAEEHPLVVGGMALAVGAALAALLPATRREQRLMGEQSAKARTAAKETVADQVRTARETAASALHEGKEEAKRQGLSREAAEQEAARVAGAGAAAVKTAAKATEERMGASPEEKEAKQQPGASGTHPGRTQSGR